MLTIPVLSANHLSEKLVALHRSGKIALMLMADALALPLCYQLALMLHLGDLPAMLDLGALTPLAFAIGTMAVFALADLYRAVTRHIDQHQLATTGLCLGLAVACTFVLLLLLRGPVPLGALLTYWFIAVAYLLVSRLTMRHFLRLYTVARGAAPKPVAIYGADEAGAQLALSMRAGGEYSPVCFFDQKRACDSRTIAGLRVFHADRLLEVADHLGIGAVVIALPAASAARLKQVGRLLGESGIACKVLGQLMRMSEDGAPALPRRDELRLEDLLGRTPVPPDKALFAKCVRGKSVLVTGAGGSIGGELCRQIATLEPSRLHLLDHSEFALYTISQELQALNPALLVRAHLGSVCSRSLVERIMQEDSIDTVYHAAAYKHVPLVENNLVEGLRNNVLGAQVIASAAEKFLVETCVLISSDKAVRPTTIMGASKRIAELIFQAAATHGGIQTTFCMVRFGNVLGSSGSVVPLFQRQLRQGGPLTITHPEVSRYFMLIPEAAQLVIQAGAMAAGGEVYVLDMGEPIRILDLARSMIVKSGLVERNAQQPHGQIDIKFVGLFPGEKLHEELLTADRAEPSAHPRILCMKEDAFRPAILDQYIDLLLTACDTNDRWLIEAILRIIVNEFTPQARGDGATPTADEPVRGAIVQRAAAIRAQAS